ncbi:transporter substrate-binding domain-containing protein [Aureimonas fodinaquatilis]|uniref:Transporter substrate-binding domain-containing protein n=1 Tax=Aureimonas fodinaquatilis TaxID=2565783 RepID=A0A5B0DWP0_9HYPH|nr:transporter substrate-binding domain-containing protein [Aureimonas fodinaquatilis]KAA0971164.1 transporter substrate-binding domain-containing protein [Aureimonas fodinaquatilis]
MKATCRAFLIGLSLIAFGSLQNAAMAQTVATPNFIDQQQRVASPAAFPVQRIRFLTSVEFPPFSFLDSRGQLAGFNVELARAICEELQLIDICQIEALPFADLEDRLQAGEGEAIIAGLAINSANRDKYVFTRSYFRFPARFVTVRGKSLNDALDNGLPAQKIAVVGATAHEAMLKTFFPASEAVPFASRDEAFQALRDGQAEALFGDGVSLAFWLASDDAQDCCVFAGGPYFSAHFLGEGLAIALKPENKLLAERFDEALTRLVASRSFSELLLKYFPNSAF